MNPLDRSRYQQVSRRAVLKASLGAGAVALLPGIACANSDAEVFAGAATEPLPTSTSVPTAAPEATAEPGAVATDTAQPAAEQDQEAPTAQPATAASVAVAGEMVISFTYTQAVGGKNENPYVAVWIEDAAGELAETVALYYQVERRGERWLDHLSRWYPADQDRIGAGGADVAATISSATRTPGAYAVAWDGSVAGAPAPAGDYFVCIEAVREDGPYSLIREPFNLAGTLANTMLTDDGELSAASVRIDA